MATEQDLSPEFIALLRSIKGKRPKTVIEHLLEFGSPSDRMKNRKLKILSRNLAMTQIPLPIIGSDRDVPLPLQVANKWNFTLKTLTEGNVLYYRFKDWLIGLVDEKYAKQRIRECRRPDGFFNDYVDSIHTVKESAIRHEDVDVEYVTEQVLYRATIDIRVTKNRKESTPCWQLKIFWQSRVLF